MMVTEKSLTAAFQKPCESRVCERSILTVLSGLGHGTATPLPPHFFHGYPPSSRPTLQASNYKRNSNLQLYRRWWLAYVGHSVLYLRA
jgi:hypothetical protein